MVIKLSGVNSREITTATFTVAIYYRGWHVHSTTRDICGGARPVDPPCPFECVGQGDVVLAAKLADSESTVGLKRYLFVGAMSAHHPGCCCLPALPSVPSRLPLNNCCWHDPYNSPLPPRVHRPGNLTIISSDKVPSLAPPGPYQMHMSAVDNGNNVMCMDIWFRMVTSPSAVSAAARGLSPLPKLLAWPDGSSSVWRQQQRLWPRFLRWLRALLSVIEQE